jgi:hypothetical protein
MSDGNMLISLYIYLSPTRNSPPGYKTPCNGNHNNMRKKGMGITPLDEEDFISILADMHRLRGRAVFASR